MSLLYKKEKTMELLGGLGEKVYMKGLSVPGINNIKK